MLFERRKFLTTAFLATVATSMGLHACQSSDNQNPSHRHKKNPHSKPGFPIIIATWSPNLKATEVAWRTLKNGGTALDAVEAGARVPEADPADTSVGYGGLPDRDGKVTLDACIMDANGNAGSVTFLQGIKHPVSVARKVMEKTPHVMLSGEGALQFALEQGFEVENLLTEAARKAWGKMVHQQ